MKTGKDKLEKMAHTKMIYKINCLDFEVTYVGQIKRQLPEKDKPESKIILDTDIKKNCRVVINYV